MGSLLWQEDGFVICSPTSIQVAQDPKLYFAISFEIYPVITLGTWFPFCHLLQLIGLQWRYLNLPPHWGPGLTKMQSSSSLDSLGIGPIANTVSNSSILFVHIPVCHGNQQLHVHNQSLHNSQWLLFLNYSIMAHYENIPHLYQAEFSHTKISKRCLCTISFKGLLH